MENYRRDASRIAAYIINGASAQTTAATYRNGNDPVSVSSGCSGMDGDDPVSPVDSGRPASVRAVNMFAALTPSKASEDCARAS